MRSKRNSYKFVHFLALIVFLTFITLTSLLSVANAADITNRSILIGSSFPSEVTTHTYTFDTTTASNVGSIQFQYCSNSPLFNDPCTPPAGLNVQSAAIDTQTGLSGFIVSPATSATNLIISRVPVAETPTSVELVFSNIVNPSTSNEVDYVRITIFDNVDGTGTAIDTGAVVFVVDDRFNIDAYVPPYLTFCVAVSVALDCTTVSGFLASFGEFSEFGPTAVTSQMAAATNDLTGYNIFVNGLTMTSGSNTIPALATQTASAPGVSQFGINLRSNSAPSTGSNPEAGAVASGSPAPNYNIPNLFRFVNGDRVAGSTISTGFNRYTVSYIVNVSSDQAPGLYASTLTYTAIASF